MMQQLKWALFSFKGRMRRKDYWFYKLPLFLFSLKIGEQLNNMLFSIFTSEAQAVTINIDNSFYLLTLGYLFVAYFSLAVAVKRLKDRNRSLWFIVLLQIPVVGFFYELIDLGFYEGTKGDNRYGRDPKGVKPDSNDIGTFEG